MLTIESINPDRQLSTALAIYFARQALPVWQQKYPEDLRPEKALEAAEKVLFAAVGPATAYQYTAADAAAYAAAAYAAAADTAADTADAAAAYAAAAANAAAAAANAAAYVADAAYAADAFSYNAALGKNAGSFAHHHLTRLLPIILWHKLDSKRRFAEPEKILELLPEDCREDFLFNLDSLR